MKTQYCMAADGANVERTIRKRDSFLVWFTMRVPKKGALQMGA
ncbi:hypothetical protein PDESU_02039 [Pontiella desulfatans]|uniref:Uncharacterized protein n=1 Tax=Pontiella desulfatans TaxID=2750659 RepID=A0A6C2U0N0_PONDE|nr:hypothetical protein [Pontiella desulfatans]VGO13482.1 hypothetical protein PDESU_02039 [Pontiella desulfatans]